MSEPAVGEVENSPSSYFWDIEMLRSWGHQEILKAEVEGS